MRLLYEVEPTQFVVRVYDERHPDNYIAHALIRTYGDRGLMSSIVGARFYEALAANVPDLMRQAGVRTLEGYMTDAHARLLRVALRRTSDVAIACRGICAGRDMPWVVVTVKGDTPAPA